MTSWSLRDLSGPLVPNAMRFPSILGFDGKGRARDVAELLRPCPSEGMRAYRVSTAINRVRNDGPGCVEAVA